MKKSNIIKLLVRGVIFIILLILFYFMYMKTAIEQFTKGSTTIMNIQFSFSFASQNVDVFEEVLIIDEISLIGLLGGSLGLFIGFSFFGYITTFLDAVLDKICEWISIG